MKETKLTELLKNFTENEIKELEKFVESPYFNRGRDVTPLLKFLKKFHPDYENEKLTEELIIKNLYPDKKHDDKKSYSLLKTITSDLFKLSKEFLIYSEFGKDVNRKNIYLLNQLRIKKAFKEFEKEYQNAVEYEEKSEDGSADEILNKYYLNLAFAEFSVAKSDAPNFYESAFKCAEYSVMFALIKAFRLSELKFVSRSFCDFDPGFNLAVELISNIDENKFISEIRNSKNKYYPLIEISYLIHKMTIHPEDQQYYKKLKELFDNHLDILGHAEKYMILGMMGSYCVRMINEYNMFEYSKEHFNIYDKSLKLGVYKYDKDDDMHVSTFRNIVICATEQRKLDWLLDFINKYSHELDASQRDNMKYYSLTYLYLAEKNYDKALENLLKVKYDFFMFKIDVKNLYVRIYFETDQIEQCFYVLETMKRYIASTKDINPFFKKRNTTLIKYVTSLLKIKSSGNYESLDELKFRIKNEKIIESRKWLIRMIDEMSGKTVSD